VFKKLKNVSIIMDEEAEKLNECKLDKNGNVRCKIPKDSLERVQNEGVKPNKLILEVEDWNA